MNTYDFWYTICYGDYGLEEEENSVSVEMPSREVDKALRMAAMQQNERLDEEVDPDNPYADKELDQLRTLLRKAIVEQEVQELLSGEKPDVDLDALLSDWRESPDETDEQIIRRFVEDQELEINYPEELDGQDNISWEDYLDYAYAMETVNGDILTMEAGFQRKVLDKLLEKLGVSEEQLGAYLNGEEEDERFRFLERFDMDAVAEILGFDEESGGFACDGLDGGDGWTANKLLSALGFYVEEDSYYGAHGDDASGVCYIP